jgi:rhodanese-related sulfurtransferase
MLAIFALFVALAAAGMAAATEVPRTTKEELKAKMDAGESVVIVDVRAGSDWSGAEFKIKGAVRADDVDAFAASQVKDAEIVLYCS